MTDAEWEAIKPLAEAKALAQLRLDMWLASNTPIDPRARIESDIQGSRLKAEFADALDRLNAAEKALHVPAGAEVRA